MKAFLQQKITDARVSDLSSGLGQEKVFSTAVITNYNTFSCLNNANILPQFCRSKIQHASQETKIKVLVELFSFPDVQLGRPFAIHLGHRQNPGPCSFRIQTPISLLIVNRGQGGGRLCQVLEAAHISWVMVSFHIFKARNSRLSNSSNFSFCDLISVTWPRKVLCFKHLRD